MPVPVAVWVVGALLVGALGGGSLVLNWDKVIARWKGKRLAVLGAEGVGKTTLITFLHEGWIPKKYKPTRGTVRTGVKRFELKDLNLVLRKSADVGGLYAARDQWIPRVKEAQILVYMVDAHALFNGDAATEGRVESDTLFIRGHLEGSRTEQVFVIGTFADQIPGYRSSDEAVQATLERRFAEHPSIQQATTALRSKNVPAIPVLIGSLATLEDCQDLVFAMFRQVDT